MGVSGNEGPQQFVGSLRVSFQKPRSLIWRNTQELVFGSHTSTPARPFAFRSRNRNPVLKVILWMDEVLQKTLKPWQTFVWLGVFQMLICPDSQVLMIGHNPWRSHFGVDEHPCATYFDVHQGYRVLTHSHVLVQSSCPKYSERKG